ncbi:MAG: hypothetical protein ACI8P7_001455 [Candidatus Azotimanducaceae bacterium]|jgi:hypothetical protein
MRKPSPLFTCILLFINTSVFAQDFCLEDVVNYESDFSSTELISDDFDQDGYLDIAITNKKYNDESDVTVFLNKGDGTFYPAVHYLTDVGNESLASGDLNEDGYPDIAVTNYNSHTISVLLNKKDGTFLDAVHYPFGAFPFEIMVADIDKDGHNDLVFGNQANRSLVLMWGEGDGSFQDTSVFALPGSPNSIQLADLDNDQSLDVLVSCKDAENSISVFSQFSGRTPFSYVRYPFYGSWRHTPREFQVAYINQDSLLDIVVCHSNSDSISIRYGNGTGGFLAPFYFPFMGRSVNIDVLHLNGDAFADMVVANRDYNGYDVYLGNANGTFDWAENTIAWVNTSSVLAGDFNNDGKEDVALSSSGAGSTKGALSIMLNCYEPIGLQEQTAQTMDISLYPNPFQEKTSIHLSGTNMGGGNSLGEIFSLNGERIKTFAFSGEQFTLSKEGMKTGVYLLRLQCSNGQRVSKKIIVL